MIAPLMELLHRAIARGAPRAQTVLNCLAILALLWSEGTLLAAPPPARASAAAAGAVPDAQASSGAPAADSGRTSNARHAAGQADLDVIILCYHHVESVAKNDFTVTTAEFRQQLDWLASSGIHVVSLPAVVDALRGTGPPVASPAVVLTFDDGWRCAYENAVPLILERHWPVTLYLYPAMVHAGSLSVTAAEYTELAKNPLVTIACHSQTHPNAVKEQEHRSSESYAQFLQTEYARSKDVLAKMIGVKIEHLAYPYGIYDAEIMKIVAGAGFRSAASINASPNGPGTDPMLLNRFMIMKGDGVKGFARKLSTLPLKVTAIDPPDGAIVPASTRAFACTVADPSEIAGKPSMIAGHTGLVAYDPASGKATITIAGALKPGVHQIAIWGKDAATGKSRRASWQVRVR